MHPNSSILASCPLRPARSCGRPAQAATHTYQPPSGNSQKAAKSAIPHLAGHTPQPTPRRFPHASDPHTGHILIQPQSDYAPTETSGRFTQTYASNLSTQIPCSDEGGIGVRVQHRFATLRRRLRRRRQGAGAASSSGGGPAWYLAPIWLPVMWNSGPDTAGGKPMILRPAAANHNSFLSKATQRTHGL